MKLPDLFDSRGLLPAGDYDVTFSELRSSLLVEGPRIRVSESWDTRWRLHLVDQAAILARQLWDAGITEVFLNGSFVEAKDHPNDIDGYFVCDVRQFASGQLQHMLNALDPHKIWTWDPATRKSYRGYAKKQLPMWHRYRVELYPHFGQPSGVIDKHGYPLLFPSAFRTQRSTDEPKGIVKIIAP